MDDFQRCQEIAETRQRGTLTDIWLPRGTHNRACFSLRLLPPATPSICPICLLKTLPCYLLFFISDSCTLGKYLESRPILECNYLCSRAHCSLIVLAIPAWQTRYIMKYSFVSRLGTSRESILLLYNVFCKNKIMLASCFLSVFWLRAMHGKN